MVASPHHASGHCGYAALTKAPPDYEVLSVEFKVNLLRPAPGEHFLAIGSSAERGEIAHRLHRRGQGIFRR